MKNKLESNPTHPEEVMIADKIRSEFNEAILSEKAASCFKLPHHEDFHLIYGNPQVDTENTLKKANFIICPFDSRSKKSVFINIERQNTTRLPVVIDKKDTDFSLLKSHLPSFIDFEDTGPEEFKSVTQKGREQIFAGIFKKLVISRIKKLPIPKDFDIASVFLNLCQLYPTSFISIHYTPQYGLWAEQVPNFYFRERKIYLKLSPWPVQRQVNRTGQRRKLKNKQSLQNILRPYFTMQMFRIQRLWGLKQLIRGIFPI